MLVHVCWIFFCNDTATTEIYTLSLHDALPIWLIILSGQDYPVQPLSHTESYLKTTLYDAFIQSYHIHENTPHTLRSEEHTSELQSRQYLVCRLLLETKTRVQDAPPLADVPLVA